MNESDRPNRSRALTLDSVAADDRVRSTSLKRNRSKPDSPNSSQEKSFDGDSGKRPKKKKTASRKEKNIKTQNKTTDSILRHFSRAAPTMSQHQSRESGEGEMEEEWADVENDEPSNKDILQCVKRMHGDLSKRFDTQSEAMESIRVEFSEKLKMQEEKVEVLQGEVFDLKNQNDSLKKELEELKKREREVEGQMKEVRFSAKLAEDRSNRNEQYSRRNNVKLLYVEESNGETAAECEEKVLDIFHNKLGLRAVRSDDIEAAHRIGSKQRNHDVPRPIIVRLLSRKTKKLIIANRRKLKGKKTVIVEDLTKANYTLWCIAQEHPGVAKAWTLEGTVFVRDKNGGVCRIESHADLSKVTIMPDDRPRDHFWHRSSVIDA